MKLKSAHNRGFTLIEILMTLAILGVVSAFALIAIDPRGRVFAARDADRKTALRQVADSLDAYYVKNREYPYSCGVLPSDSCDSFNDTNWVPDLVSTGFIKSLPFDPLNDGFTNTVNGPGHTYFYISFDNNGGIEGTYYILGTWLENTDDPLTLDNLGGNPTSRPKWPDCTTDINFNGNIMIYRSYTCPGDPVDSL